MKIFHFTKITDYGREKGLEVRKNDYRRHFSFFVNHIVNTLENWCAMKESGRTLKIY